MMFSWAAFLIVLIFIFALMCLIAVAYLLENDKYLGCIVVGVLAALLIAAWFGLVGGIVMG